MRRFPPLVGACRPPSRGPPSTLVMWRGPRWWPTVQALAEERPVDGRCGLRSSARPLRMGRERVQLCGLVHADVQVHDAEATHHRVGGGSITPTSSHSALAGKTVSIDLTGHGRHRPGGCAVIHGSNFVLLVPFETWLQSPSQALGMRSSFELRPDRSSQIQPRRTSHRSTEPASALDMRLKRRRLALVRRPAMGAAPSLTSAPWPLDRYRSRQAHVSVRRADPGRPGVSARHETSLEISWSICCGRALRPGPTKRGRHGRRLEEDGGGCIGTSSRRSATRSRKLTSLFEVEMSTRRSVFASTGPTKETSSKNEGVVYNKDA